jgi:ribonucleoside-diphosphate reductase alpha chain
MLQDLLNTYKYGWKTSYYQNTYDYKEDPSSLEEEVVVQQPIDTGIPTNSTEDELCEACAI